MLDIVKTVAYYTLLIIAMPIILLLVLLYAVFADPAKENDFWTGKQYELKQRRRDCEPQTKGD